MKPTRFLLIMPLLFIGCSQPVDFSDLVERNGTYYIKVTDEPYTGKTEDFWPNGQLKVKGTFKDGKRHGPFETYHENGQLEAKGTYKSGKKDGPFEAYYENGQLEVKGTFKDYMRDGLWEEYNDKGQLELISRFKDGEQVE